MLVKYLRYFIRDYLFALLSAIFLICYWVSAYKLPAAALQYPKVITVITIVFVLWNFYRSVVNFKKVKDEPINAKPFDITFKLNTPKIVVILGTILYAVCVYYVGFVVSTVAYLLCMPYYLGVRKPLPLCVFAFGLTGFFYVVFRMALAVRLPTGFLI
jgi:hypothetical protein